MDDGDSKTKNIIKKQKNKDFAIQRHGLDVSSVLQSFWLRCRSVFPNITDRRFMESELRFVLYCGILFWLVHLFHQIFTK